MRFRTEIAMFQMLREDVLITSPTLKKYFKDVCVHPNVKFKMDISKKKIRGV